MSELVVEQSVKFDKAEEPSRLWIWRMGNYLNVGLSQKSSCEVMTFHRVELEALHAMIEVALRETDPTKDPVSGEPSGCCDSPERHF